MSDLPISDPRVGESVARCLMGCGGAVDKTLIECKEIMSEQDWRILRLGFGHVLGGEIHEMWKLLIQHHPKFNSQEPEN